MVKIRRNCLSVAVCLFFFHGSAWAVEFCVDPNGGGTHTDLQAALTVAYDNGSEDTIKVVQGVYNGNFNYSSSEGYSITVEGGYTSGCVAREVNPALTVLDGGNTDRALSLSDYNGGGITVDGFSMRNGSSSGFGGGVSAYSASTSSAAGNITLRNNVITENSAVGDGGGIHAESTSTTDVAGTVILANNIISDNSADSAGGVYARSYSQSGMAGTIVLTNNTIIKNSTTGAGSLGGGVFASSYSIANGSPGMVTFTNNTIISNTAVVNGGGVYMYAYSGSTPGTINCYNNIIRENTGASGGDIFLDGVGTNYYGYNNDYTTIAGTWGGGSGNNINIDPLFVDPLAGDYHLQSNSPCIDAGANSAPELPAFDFEGDERKIDGNNDGTKTVDMGADEFIPVLNPFSWPMFLPAITNSIQ